MTRLVRVRTPSSICFADRDRPQLPLKLENLNFNYPLTKKAGNKPRPSRTALIFFESS
ncbi:MULTISPECIES: hypothetical protein [unclassified Microcoleus]|uniref:hypothetical protein n=1 Tax=unclassified Microcoleus TaxID=2642155 RepID=UPI001DDA3E4D|nr:MULTISPECIES: hypothetical protein [unclassified Microcoleus]MCC3421757.1 hypothetical protein [Microcoleus sp. PH2017_07_MST_O_A]MCC3432200.1 hypothetical protein [Microcoleus sp. PH2017_04_SCI_O_A]MCC3443935.1 hypothetical protein [Microcoleus sp. PH2017_03_ELD_O_A]MCC3447816.1 hypothetical protein [Microcoleus sp. PH2017_09_SFU_O_A]MCC3468421.1 hypothetical protein [Microcoleus sp. PH2017_06_SFM_O_A]MCC3504136.1 hypothetical protein [Microcoleus sp. PH2017_19_SFW_U_A]